MRLDNLKVAREMEEAKKDAKAIKMATGWERGADGKWRYEIDDLKYFPKGDAGLDEARSMEPWSKELDDLSERIFDGEELSEKEMSRFDALAEQEAKWKADYLNREKPHLADWIEDKELFAAYPDLKRVEMMFTDQLPQSTGGSYSVRDNRIVVNTNYVGDTASVIVHEVQHAIQFIEGFAKGGSPEYFDAVKKTIGNIRERVDKGLDDAAKTCGVPTISEWIMSLDDEHMMSIFAERKESVKQHKEFALSYVYLNHAGFKKADRELLKSKLDKANEMIAEQKRNIGNKLDKDSYTTYKSLAGEVEARNAQERMSMSADERRRSLASETEDVAREDQIFLFGDGDSASIDHSKREDDRTLSQSLTDEKALSVLENMFKDGTEIAMPKKISSISEFRSIFNKPIKTFLNETINVGDGVFNKLVHKNRSNISGAIFPTLRDADFAIHDTDGSTLYVKRFKSGNDHSYNVAVVNKYGEVEDYVSSVHIKSNNNILNKIRNGAELLLPNKRNGDELLAQNNSTPTAKVAEKSDNAKSAPLKRAEGESIFDFTNRAAERVQRTEAMQNEDTDSHTDYSRREGPEPKKTIPVYKLMRLGEDGKPYPLFIDNANPLEMGVCYDADAPDLSALKPLKAGVYLVDTKTNKALQSLDEFRADHPELSKTRKVDGYTYPANEAINYATEHGLRWMHIEDTERGQKRFGGESRKYWNIGINGSNAPFKFSMRPGWHAGSLPTMRQIGKGANRDLRDDRFVWVKGEVSADIDYNEEAQRNPDKDIPDRIPKDGFYLKATNANKKASQADKVGWYVAGTFKPNYVISDAQARKVIDDWNAEHHDNVLYDFDREGGKEFTDEDAARINRINGVDFSKREVSPDTPIAIVHAEADHRFKNYAEAKLWAKENIARTYSNEETGGKGSIRISNTAIGKFLSQSAVGKSDNKDIHLSVLKVLPDVIRESLDAEQHPDFLKNKEGERSADNGTNPDVTIHRLYGAVDIDGETYRVKITVKAYSRNENLPSNAYSYEATKIELLAGTLGKLESDAPNTSNSITAANLLKGVDKSYSNEKFFAPAQADEQSNIDRSRREDRDYSRRTQESARDRYERRVKSGMFQTVEALQNSMLGLQEAA